MFNGPFLPYIDNSFYGASREFVKVERQVERSVFAWPWGSGPEFSNIPSKSKLIIPSVFTLAKLLLGLPYLKRRPICQESAASNSQARSITSTTEETIRSISTGTMMTESCSSNYFRQPSKGGPRVSGLEFSNTPGGGVRN